MTPQKLATVPTSALLALLVLGSPASASVGIDVNVSTDATQAGTVVTSPQFSTTAPNELLLAFVSADYRSGSNTTVKSISGGSLKWSLVMRANVQRGTAEIAAMYAPATRWDLYK